MQEGDLRRSIEKVLEGLEGREDLEITRGVDSAIIKRREATQIGWLGVRMNSANHEELIWSAVDPGKPIRLFRTSWKKDGTNLTGIRDHASDTIVEVILGDLGLL
jgi:hypothetical protein